MQKCCKTVLATPTVYIIVIIFSPKYPTTTCRYDCLVVIYSVAYLIADTQESLKNKKMGFADVIISYNFLFRLLVLVGLLIKSLGFFMECTKPGEGRWKNLQASFSFSLDCSLDDPAALRYRTPWSPVAIGYCIYGVAMTMSMLKILYWSQLHHVLGPLSISIKKVMKDLVLVATAYLLFLFSFSLCIKYVLELSQREYCTKDEVKMREDNTYIRVSGRYQWRAKFTV